MINTDIVVIGGGCVGLTAALGLAQTGYSVAVIDAQSGQKVLQEPELRVSAISAASENVFKGIGAWQYIDQDRVAAYQSMKVWDKHSFGKIEFSAEDISEHRLGHIIENNNIRNALIQAAEKQSNIQLLFQQKVNAIHNTNEQVVLTLENGAPVIAKLAIAADGANSWVRKQLNMPVAFSDYDHHAIVTTVETTQPHNNTARQVFLPSGPVALLPMSDPNVCSVVWSTSPIEAKALIDNSAEEFAKQLTVAFDSELGVCSVISERQSYPLTMRYAQKWVEHRVVFMGDAAHTIHPLAGLGMNLGLLDAASLVDVMKTAKGFEANELSNALTHYQGWRKAEAQQYIAAMSGLKNLFSGENPIKKIIRGIGLSLVNKTTLVKNEVIKHAMGTKGDIPTLAKRVDEL